MPIWRRRSLFQIFQGLEIISVADLHDRRHSIMKSAIPFGQFSSDCLFKSSSVWDLVMSYNQT